MTLDIGIRDREQERFRESGRPPGERSKVAVEVENSDSNPVPVVIVDAPSASETLVNEYNEISSVPSGIATTIVSYVVPVGKTLYLTYANGSGGNIGLYTFEIDGIVEDKKRSYYTEFNVDFVLNQKANAGQVVRVRINHSGDVVSDHNAKISGVLI